MVLNHDLTEIVVGVTVAGIARDLAALGSRLSWRREQGTLLSTCNPA